MLKDMIVSLLGEYTPVVVDNVPLQGMAGVDYAYIGALLCLLICMYSVWRLIGGWFK